LEKRKVRIKELANVLTAFVDQEQIDVVSIGRRCEVADRHALVFIKAGRTHDAVVDMIRCQNVPARIV